jgi:hypothetical protein
MRAVLALSAVIVVAACGIARPGAPPPTGITITLTDAGCTVEGAGALLPEQFKATLSNKTSRVMAVLVKRLNDGHAYAELEANITERQKRMAAGGSELATGEFKPTFATDQTYTWVSPQQTLIWEATLVAGTYGIVCRRDSTTAEVIEAIYVLGPYRVV